MENNLSMFLGKNKMTISKFSEITGISRSTLSKIYYEKSDGIKYDTLKKILKALDITPNEFFK